MPPLYNNGRKCMALLRECFWGSAADTQQCDFNIPCQPCKTNDQRESPKACIGAHFDWERCESALFPGETVGSVGVVGTDSFL